MGDSIIQVRDIGKSYLISHESAKESYISLRDVLTYETQKIFNFSNRLKKDNAVKKVKTEEFWALKDVNFDIKQGERVGIIGRNGAGKSTLLKIISRITEPSTGEIKIKGRVASLLEVGTGFHPELSGRENIFLNGAIMGMSRNEIKAKFDEIVAFAEVEKFLDTPVKRYSSGMYVRLAFAVAAHLEPEILIIDEVLAVGDVEFQHKCMGKIEDVSNNKNKTVLFVSHNLGIVKQLCQKAILLTKGQISSIGTSQDIVSNYLNQSLSLGKYVNESKPNKESYFERISVHDIWGIEKYEFNHDEKIIVKFKNRISRKLSSMSVFVMVLDRYKKPVFPTQSFGIEENMNLEIESGFLTRGYYSIQAFIHVPRIMQYDSVFDICQFSICDNGSALAIHGDYDYGNVFGRCKWD
jgi:lipopolysaccharide transport system ATP-binding protein